MLRGVFWQKLAEVSEELAAFVITLAINREKMQAVNMSRTSDNFYETTTRATSQKTVILCGTWSYWNNRQVEQLVQKYYRNHRDHKRPSLDHILNKFNAALA
jgi:hypothetical protein